MRKSLRWSCVAAHMVGLVACGSAPSSVIGHHVGGTDGTPIGGDDASTDGTPVGGNDSGTDGTPVGADGGGTGSAPPSCVGLAMTCGAVGADNCCTSPQVAGGTYDRSYDVAGDGNSGNMNFPATVSSFRLDKYEVTVGRSEEHTSE